IDLLTEGRITRRERGAAEDQAERRWPARQLTTDEIERAARLGGGGDVGGGEAASVRDQPAGGHEAQPRENNDRDAKAMNAPAPPRGHRVLSEPGSRGGPRATRGGRSCAPGRPAP